MARTFQITWTMTAANELEDTCTFLAERSRKGLATFQKDILELLDRLERFPEIGSLYPLDPVGDVRETLAGKYRVLYCIDDEKYRI